MINAKLAAIFLGLLAFCPFLEMAQAQETRPNIVFAFADDWGQQASAYQKLFPSTISDAVSTPNFDRIANEGILFTQAFVSAPSCTPCRSSLFSGRNFWETGRGAILRGAVWDETIPTFPLELQKAGYHIGFSSKAWSPGANPDAPFGGRANRFNKRGGRFNGFSQNLSKNTNNADTTKQALTAEVANNFQDFMDARAADQPFLYFWGPTNVHRKWTAGSGKKFWGIDPDSLTGKLPKFLPDVEIVREDMADYLGEVQAFDAGLGALMAELEKNGQLENTIIIVSGDHGPAGFSNGKCSLYDFGTRVSLAIRMPGGGSSRVQTDLVSIPDLAPTILEMAGVQVPDDMTAKSLLPRLAESKPDQNDPHREFVVTGRERHVESARAGNLPYPQRAIRTDDFLFIRNFEPDRTLMGDGPSIEGADKDLPSYELLSQNTRVTWADFDASPTKAWIAYNCREEPRRQFFQFAFGKRPARELYSVADDPDQVNNLADDPAYAEKVKQLESQLMDYLTEHNDPRVTGDRMTFEKSPFAGPIKKANK